VYMLPGILIGEATQELTLDMAANMMLRLILVGLFVIFCAWTLYKIFILVRDKITLALSALWDSMEGSPYFSFITKALRHHNVLKTHGQIVLAFYLLLTALAFVYLAFYVCSQKELDIVANSSAYYIFRSMRTPAWDDVMVFFTLLGDKKVLVPVIAIVLGWLAYKKHWRIFWHATVMFALTGASVMGLKHIFHIIRPWGIATSPENFSFPSGHSELAASFYIGLSLLYLQSPEVKCKRTVYFLAFLVIFLVSVSRLYLGAHWLTDVVGGWLLSGTILMFTALSYNRHQENRFNAKNIVYTAVLLVIVNTNAFFYYGYDHYKAAYRQLDWPRYTYAVDTWWSQDHNVNLPLYRIGRVGVPIEVLNLQWVGNIRDIKDLLLKQGWHEPPNQGWRDVLPRITDVTSAQHLPLVSPLYLGKKPVLVLVKTMDDNKKPIVLRLWDSNISIKGTDKKLWVGSVGIVPRTYSWLITYKHSDFTLAPDVIFDQATPEFEIKQSTTLTNLKHRLILQPVILIKPKDLS
jgi:membrane-associated phospholipid phosphatase